jgi:hypothetical protein
MQADHKNKIIQCGDLKFKLLYSKEEIDKQVDRLAF